MAGAYLAISCVTSAHDPQPGGKLHYRRNGVPVLHSGGLSRRSSTPLEQFGSARLADFVTAFSVMTHFEGFQRGVLDSRDVLFFLSVIVFSLFTTSVILRTHRAG
jgi:ABC-2 type transport system permease protein